MEWRREGVEKKSRFPPAVKNKSIPLLFFKHLGRVFLTPTLPFAPPTSQNLSDVKTPLTGHKRSPGGVICPLSCKFHKHPFLFISDSSPSFVQQLYRSSSTEMDKLLFLLWGERERERKKDKSFPVSASLLLPFSLSMQVWSHFQAQPDVFQIYKLDFPSAQQWVSLPSSSTCQLSSPFSSFLPASLPSKMTHSQERSRFFQFSVSSLKRIAFAQPKPFLPPISFSLNSPCVCAYIRMYEYIQFLTAAVVVAGSSSAFLSLWLSLTPHLSVAP